MKRSVQQRKVGYSIWSYLKHKLTRGKMNAQLSRHCTVQKIRYKNEIVIHAKSFMLNFNTGA